MSDPTCGVPTDPPGLRRVSVADGNLIGYASADIAAACRPDLTELARLTVVVPSLNAAAGIAHAVHAACASPVLVLPRIVTLRSWAATVDPGCDVTPPAAREAALYRVLAERDWLSGTDLWAVAAELSVLFDELTRWKTALPGSADEFALRLDTAYGARAGASFGFEARLVHALWRAAQAGTAVDTETAYGLALAKLAAQVDGPILVLGRHRPAPVEDEFVRRCAERVPVTVYEHDRMAASTPVGRVLAQAWPRPARFDLADRATVLAQAFPHSPLAAHVRIFAAAHAEDEALAVAEAIKHRLAQGRRQIAVVVLDRMVARRARALLERDDILVRDEAGWALSTTSAATVIGRWLDVVSNDFYYTDCLDLLKSPFVFCDWARAERQDAVWRFERALGRANLRSGLDVFLKLTAADDDPRPHQLLMRVDRAARQFARRRTKTLTEWLNALLASLVELGVRDGLAADAAGIELLALLEGLQSDLEGDRVRLAFPAWRRWLARQLEAASFRDRDIESPVVFTTLDATRLRRFDAVVLLGADATHLPGAAGAGLFFNQGVRRELGLPGREEVLADLEDTLTSLIAGCSDILITWQRAHAGEETLLSPLIERLVRLHRLAWGTGLDDTALNASIAAARGRERSTPGADARTRPAPRVPPSRVPAAISASGYNTLLACPYQFYARYVLGLVEQDEVREEIDKADYGIRVHQILAAFHRTHPRIDALTCEDAVRALAEISAREFRDLIDNDYEARAWLDRWLALVPQYVEWQRAREAEGWYFVAAEADRRIEIESPAGRTLVLRGRIDRVDRHEDGRVEVLDYKTRAADALKRGLEVRGEDVQLAVYALLWRDAVERACYLSIDRDGVQAVRGKPDLHIEPLAAAVRARLAVLFDAIAAGAPLPAQGADDVCRFCEMRGLCRKDYWVDHAARSA